MKQLHAKPRFIPSGRVLDPLIIGDEPMTRPVTGAIPDVTGKRPDSELDGADLPGLVVRAASVRGDAHRRRGTPRQDSMGLWQIDDTRLLACAAGGVADAELSHVGSAEACTAARRALAGLLRHVERGAPVKHFFEDVADDLRGRAERDRVPVEALRTTLLTAIIDIGEQCAHVARIGDGGAMILRGGDWSPCLPEETGTPHALPGDTGHLETATVDLGEGDMLLLCTGGLAGPMRGGQVSDQASAWWAQATAPSLPEFFWQLSFRAESYDADRTAICAWRL
ncbi:protein phosphatase 2C domain-containing protein [Streptosporangium sp. NPDC051022]|uniref:protein phosphatase 2C domain-containing protein n=1 Tax=Streptosporangium sp. NPDC051022 TaxID=3155752 RepID=UPI0034488B98